MSQSDRAASRCCMEKCHETGLARLSEIKFKLLPKEYRRRRQNDEPALDELWMCEKHIEMIPCKCVFCGKGGPYIRDPHPSSFRIGQLSKDMLEQLGGEFIPKPLRLWCSDHQRMARDTREPPSSGDGHESRRKSRRHRNSRQRGEGNITKMDRLAMQHNIYKKDSASNPPPDDRSNKHKKKDGTHKRRTDHKHLHTNSVPKHPNVVPQDIDHSKRLVVVTWNVEQLHGNEGSKIQQVALELFNTNADIVNITEICDEVAALSVCAELNILCAADSIRKQEEYGVHVHLSGARHGNNLSLCLLYRQSALIGKLETTDSRFDTVNALAVSLQDPETGREFALRMRRGYLVRATLRVTGRPVVIVGVHLKSLRGNVFSHYKRMTQARIVRAALSKYLDDHDIIVLGDLNSSETDYQILPLGDQQHQNHYGTAAPKLSRHATASAESNKSLNELVDQTQNTKSALDIANATLPLPVVSSNSVTSQNTKSALDIASATLPQPVVSSNSVQSESGTKDAVSVQSSESSDEQEELGESTNHEVTSVKANINLRPRSPAREYQTINQAFSTVVPASQRTFIVQTLRCLDVRSPRMTLRNFHKDATPTWRRCVGDGGMCSTTQLDHILFRFMAPKSISKVATQDVLHVKKSKKKGRKAKHAAKREHIDVNEPLVNTGIQSYTDGNFVHVATHVEVEPRRVRKNQNGIGKEPVSYAQTPSTEVVESQTNVMPSSKPQQDELSAKISATVSRTMLDGMEAKLADSNVVASNISQATEERNKTALHNISKTMRSLNSDNRSNSKETELQVAVKEPKGTQSKETKSTKNTNVSSGTNEQLSVEQTQLSSTNSDRPSDTRTQVTRKEEKVARKAEKTKLKNNKPLPVKQSPSNEQPNTKNRKPSPKSRKSPSTLSVDPEQFIEADEAASKHSQQFEQTSEVATNSSGKNSSSSEAEPKMLKHDIVKKNKTIKETTQENDQLLKQNANSVVKEAGDSIQTSPSASLDLQVTGNTPTQVAPSSPSSTVSYVRTQRSKSPVRASRGSTQLIRSVSRIPDVYMPFNFKESKMDVKAARVIWTDISDHGIVVGEVFFRGHSNK